MLYLVATPLGNLKDIPLRALEVLAQVDGIICEDTRRTSILLNHYSIKNPLFVLNDFNEAAKINEYLKKLKSGFNFALVSDAGTPLISDPGYKLVRACLEENIVIDGIPGPNAALLTLTLSGLPPDKFLFLGYLPEKPKARIDLLKNLALIYKLQKMTFICYVSPYKLAQTLTNLQEVYGDIEVFLAKELTKIHQSIRSAPVSAWLEDFDKQAPKGEWTMCFRLGE